MASGSPVAGPAVDALPSRERAGNDAHVRLKQPLLPSEARGSVCPALAPSPRPGALDVPAIRPFPSNHRHPIGVLAATVFLAVVVAACGTAATPRPSLPADATGSLLPPITATPPPSASPSAAAAFPTTITDDEGTAVELKTGPKKIVSLTPAE